MWFGFVGNLLGSNRILCVYPMESEAGKKILGPLVGMSLIKKRASSISVLRVYSTSTFQLERYGAIQFTGAMFGSSGYSVVVLDDEELNLNQTENRGSRRPSLAWTIVVLLSLFLVQDMWQQGAMFRNRGDLGTYEEGFTTDIGGYKAFTCHCSLGSRS